MLKFVLQFLGGYNATYYSGEIKWTKIVEETFYKVLVTGMVIGNSAIDMPCEEV